jgi:hypothetical protein
MLALHMTMQVRPSKTGDITIFIGAVVSQQQHGVFKDFILLIMNSQVLIGPSKVFLFKVFESALRIIGEDDKGRLSLYRRARLVLFATKPTTAATEMARSRHTRQ